MIIGGSGGCIQDGFNVCAPETIRFDFVNTPPAYEALRKRPDGTPPMLFRENAHTPLDGTDDLHKLGTQMGDARSAQEITGFLQRPTELFGRDDGAMTVAVNRAEHDIGLLDERRQFFVTLLAIVQ